LGEENQNQTNFIDVIYILPTLALPSKGGDKNQNSKPIALSSGRGLGEGN